MAKRFTDSRKWSDPWFMELPLLMKCLWIYLLDTCDHAGIYKVNLKLASFLLGETINPADVKRYFSGRIIEIDAETWRIPKFIDFQYGSLNPDNRVHASVLLTLEKEGACKGLRSPFQGAKDKDKDKDKDKEKRGGAGEVSFTVPDLETLKKEFISSRGSVQQAERFFNHYTANGWMVGKVRMKDWKAAVKNWIARDNEQPGAKPNMSGPAHQEKIKAELEADRKKVEQWKAEAAPMPQECRETLKNIIPIREVAHA